MCDIIIALPDSTTNNTLCFGKNSDRPAGECQTLHFSERRPKKSGRIIAGSYVKVPDDGPALATLGCRPYWCWGYETGINEAGVVGGNTAIFTRSLHTKEAKSEHGLTGMELLRFGLERGDTAEKAVDAIATLLEKYGQWGSAVRGVDHDKGSYDNAYILADASEAWVLETSGKRWVAERITQGVRSLSNEPTIETDWTKGSDDLKAYAQKAGWRYPDSEQFNFAYAYGDHEHYSRQVSHIRCRRTGSLLDKHRGSVDSAAMMNILRDHYEDTFLGGPQFHQYLPDFMTICMHDSPAGFTWGNTATSVVVELDPEASHPPLIWCAYQPPCSSVYLPVAFSSNLPDQLTRAGSAGLGIHSPKSAPVDTFESGSLWWRMYRLLEAIRRDPIERHRQLRTRLDPLELSWRKKANDALSDYQDSPDFTDTREQLTADCTAALFEIMEHLEADWDIDTNVKE